MPDPVVGVSRSSSNPDVGEPFEFICNVAVVDRLIVSPEINWIKYVSLANDYIKDYISVVPVRIENELSISFLSLNISDVGEYTCEAVLTVPEINVTHSSNNSDDLSLQSWWSIMHGID